jgi:hypothetical protein
MFITLSNLRRFTMSASAPAGSVNRKKGRDATVDISDSSTVDELKLLTTQVAAVSCAETMVLETTLASHKRR